MKEEMDRAQAELNALKRTEEDLKKGHQKLEEMVTRLDQEVVSNSLNTCDFCTCTPWLPWTVGLIRVQKINTNFLVVKNLNIASRGTWVAQSVKRPTSDRSRSRGP